MQPLEVGDKFRVRRLVAVAHLSQGALGGSGEPLDPLPAILLHPVVFTRGVALKRRTARPLP